MIASPAANEYATCRRDLFRAYRDLALTVVDSSRSDDLDPDSFGELVLQLVEAVISIRASNRPVTTSVARAIASSCLRLCGVDPDAILAAQSVAGARLDAFAATNGSDATSR